MLCDVLGSPVEARMVGPLVDDAQVARELAQGSDAVFGKDGQAQAVDEFRDAVVDFRVDVVRTAAEDDGPLARLFQVTQDFLVMSYIFCLYASSSSQAAAAAAFTS